MPCNPSERVSQGSKGLLNVSYSPKVFWHILDSSNSTIEHWGQLRGQVDLWYLSFGHCKSTADSLKRLPLTHDVFQMWESWKFGYWLIDIQKLVLPPPMGCEHISKPNTKCWCICFTSLLKQVTYKNVFATFLGTLFTTCLRHINLNHVPNAQVCVCVFDVQIIKLQLQTTFPKPLYIPHSACIHWNPGRWKSWCLHCFWPVR